MKTLQKLSLSLLLSLSALSPLNAAEPSPTEAEPVLRDPLNRGRYYLLGVGGNIIKADSLKEPISGVGIKAFSVTDGTFTIPIGILHPATVKNLKLNQPLPESPAAPTAYQLELERWKQKDAQAAAQADAYQIQQERQKLREAQIRADNALAAAQLRELAAKKAQREAQATSPMTQFMRQLAIQRQSKAQQPAPPSTDNFDSAIAEQMRLDRLMRAAAEARREGRPMYVNPADARAIGR